MERKFEPVMSPGGAQRPLRDRGVTTVDRDAVVVDSSRVLRNTYWLLGLSLLPTVAGAVVGMSFNFIGLFRAAPIMTPLLMFGAMIGSLFVVTRLRNSSWGVVALFGFTFIAGLMLTPILTVAAGFRNGGQLVALAGGMTAVVFFALAGYASVSKRDFSFLGRFLFVGLILLIVASLANLFFAVPAASIDDLGDRRADLLHVHPVRRQQDRSRRRDQLHDGDDEPVPQRLQHLHQPAEHPAGLLGPARLTPRRPVAKRKQGRREPPFFTSARKPPSIPRGRCAGTC